MDKYVNFELAQEIQYFKKNYIKNKEKIKNEILLFIYRIIIIYICKNIKNTAISDISSLDKLRPSQLKILY